MPVEVTCDVKGAGRYARTLRNDATRLLALFKIGQQDGAELSLLLTGDRRIAQLNGEYRHKNEPTDVLSFAQGDGSLELVEPPGRAPQQINKINNLIGDVVISIDTAARQAAELGLSVERRLRTLLVHGFLHLLGMDHERPDDAQLMFATQDFLERRLEDGAAERPAAPRKSARKQ